MSPKLTRRRKFLRDSTALVGLAAGAGFVPPAAAEAMPSNIFDDDPALIAYGQRSPYVKSMRISVMERMSPDDFGMTFHVMSPLQDSVRNHHPIVAALHRDSPRFLSPDIDPAEHRLMIHGMVDRPLIFTVDEIKRLPFVTRPHFLECLGNRARPPIKLCRSRTE